MKFIIPLAFLTFVATSVSAVFLEAREPEIDARLAEGLLGTRTIEPECSCQCLPDPCGCSCTPFPTTSSVA
ncbi:hypothetical protein BC835DRAFT_1364970 [Cytidiella melzeri]|nr:hypothetical protein BC835DRAFT_1364970 [Cytidiella melzeri]